MKYLCLLSIIVFAGCGPNYDFSEREVPPAIKVAIQPYEDFPQNLTDTVIQTLSDFYHVETVLFENIQFPKSAFTSFRSPRYRADSMIRFQKKLLKNKEADYILGLTSKDISTTKKTKDGQIKKPESKYKDYGIMGIGYCPGNSAIVSSYRLKHSNKKLFILRVKKIAVHEFGHNLGLPHCENTSCVMTDAVESIKNIDKAQLSLCEKCVRKLSK